MVGFVWRDVVHETWRTGRVLQVVYQTAPQRIVKSKSGNDWATVSTECDGEISVTTPHEMFYICIHLVVEWKLTIDPFGFWVVDLELRFEQILHS